ncbi:MAG: Trk system potassium transporter TrkA [Prevotella sp.]|nr:Trk system potassium transporter TrkA [Prevotella sp.]MDD6817967.1 Trk system potassium transporter TrkA [Prevotellaceae bacterium]MCI7046320.1 Trk system potassium transporter TrkA [Prevotella sp.]MDD6842511.1 Trk system potassium transporter TrkA [Prevotellaceae bacterium]MDD6978060.1 Trk system potassium transporter TrkA [Prevotellaceae bacterium]
MKIIIGGAGATGTHLAKLLSRDHQECTLMDEDAHRLEGLETEYDIMTMVGSPTSIHDLKEAGVASADLFVGVTPDESRNMNACIIAHAIGAKKTVARIDNYEYLLPQHEAFFKQLGIDSLIYPEVLAAQDISNGLKLSWVRQRWDVHGGALVMLGIKLRDNCEILNQPLKVLCGPDDPYHIVAIKRGGETIIPGGNDELHPLDLAYFMTTKEYIPYIRKITGKEHYADVKNVIIMGGGKTAVRAALIKPDYMSMKIIEKDEKRCDRLNQLLNESNTMIIHGDGRDLDLLTEEGIRNTQAFVALTDNAETNILACLTAKRLGVRKTIAMVENLDYASMAEGLDIGTIINKKTIAASHIYQMMIDAEVSNMRSLMLADSDVAEFSAAPGSMVTKKKVKDLGLPFGVAIGGLVRGNHGMLVNGNSQIEAGDIVMIFCHEHNLRKVEKYFKTRSLW